MKNDNYINDLTASAIRTAIATFPDVFALRGHSGRTFRFNASASFVSSAYGMQLYVDVQNEDGTWSNFVRDTPIAFRQEMRPARSESARRIDPAGHFIGRNRRTS